MTSAFGSFDQSELGGFVESPLGVRGLGASELPRVYFIAHSGQVEYWVPDDPDVDPFVGAWAALGSLANATCLHWDGKHLWAGVGDARRWDGFAWQTYSIAGSKVEAFLEHTDGVLYCLGTSTSGAAPYSYDPVTDSWSAMDATGLTGHNGQSSSTMLTAFSKIYIVTGGNTGSVYSWNGSTWDDEDDHPSLGDVLTEFTNHASMLGGSMIIAGGRIDDGIAEETANRYGGGGRTDFAAIDPTDAGDGERKWQITVNTKSVAWKGAVYMGGHQWDTANRDQGLLKVTASAVSKVADTTTGVNVDLVKSVADANDKLMVGGEFTTFEGTTCARVALWDPVAGATFFEDSGGTPQGPGSGTVHDCLVIRSALTPPTIDDPADQVISDSESGSVQVSVSAGDAPDNWELASSTTGVTIDSTGLVSWDDTVPLGANSIQIYASNDGGWDTATFTITVQDDAPVITAHGNDIGTTGSPYSTTNALDSGDTPVTWSLTVAPSGMTINSSDGSISWPSPVGGNHPITVKAENAVGSDTDSWSLLIV